MSTPEVTTEVPADIVFELCDEYLISLEKAKKKTEENFYWYYIKQTKFSLCRMRRVPEYTHGQSLECAKNTADWQLNTWGQRHEVAKIKNLALRDLSATMQVNYEAWNMIHKRFTAATPENKHNEDF